ncbi:MAG: DUF4038 domain-containing protein [Bacillota bacterium]
MSEIRISGTKDHFEKDGKPFFYLADTVWSAFSNAAPEEWEEYLDYRRMQNFNVLQISVLPILHDRSESVLRIEPFHLNSRGTFDFLRINDAYFTRARKMVEAAAQKGFTAALVVLWCNYVPDSWASKSHPDYIMPAEAVKPYTEYVVNAFREFNPIYIISGDTAFESELLKKHYLTALETVKSMCPEALTTMHLSGGNADLPEEFVQSPHLDFYMYQSSHMAEHQNNSYYLAGKFLEKPVKKPVVNGEPCYEGHGHGNKYGRFSAFDVRKAVWQSLLSGAKAGVTYGAHGIWSWHRRHVKFSSESFSGTPFPWRAALQLQGAWDAGFARWIFEQNQLFDLEPADIIVNETGEITACVSNGSRKIAVYAPYNADIKVKMDLSGYDWTLFDLANRRVAKPVLANDGSLFVFKMHDFNTDILLIGAKQEFS